MQADTKYEGPPTYVGGRADAYRQAPRRAAPLINSTVTSNEPARAAGEAEHLRDLSRTQWTCGIAAWLGWLFDGLDMHLYTLVATPFVAELLGFVAASGQPLSAEQDARIAECSSWIQASFLIGWALGGSIFGRLGDLLGRSRALVLTILTYACFTGLSYFAQTWWHLLIFRFLAALGIGGEWAVGAALLAETWPARWRPMLAAVLQSAVNLGVLIASVAGFLLAARAPRTVFLIGVLPALIVLWIRRAVPEPEEWQAATTEKGTAPGIAELFRGDVRRTTVLTMLVCAFSLTGHWAFMFWCSQQLRALPDLADWTKAEVNRFVSGAMMLVMIGSIAGNFAAGAAARRWGYRRTIIGLCLGYAAVMVVAYCVPRGHQEMLFWITTIGAFQGVFALFTMYLPPLFPTLLRTTGAGFCYNIGRIAAAAGTVLFTGVGNFRWAMICAATLFLPAAAIATLLPEAVENDRPPELVD